PGGAAGGGCAVRGPTGGPGRCRTRSRARSGRAHPAGPRGGASGGRSAVIDSTAGLEPVVQESTPSLIARALRRGIADGSLAPGTQLGEAALARSLGVSRGPLREAMQRLTQEGLLVSHRNRGLFVADLTP